MGLAAATAVLDLFLALWGLEELVQPETVQVPGVPASFPCLLAMEKDWEEMIRVR